MKTKPICSINHFSRLITSFKKIGKTQIEKNIYLNDDKRNVLDKFTNTPIHEPTFDYLCSLLGKKFNQNQYKTHSCFDDVLCHRLVNKVWVSYTIEDSNKKRVRTREFSNNFIVFKIYIQIGHFRKKRVARWGVPITWH